MRGVRVVSGGRGVSMWKKLVKANRGARRPSKKKGSLMAPLVRSYVMRASAAGMALGMVGMILPRSYGQEITSSFFAVLAMTLLTIFGAVWIDTTPQRHAARRHRVRVAAGAHRQGVMAAT